jgi:hypothetical protein
MFYHPFQLFVCGFLANQFAASHNETEGGTRISRKDAKTQRLLIQN